MLHEFPAFARWLVLSPFAKTRKRPLPFRVGAFCWRFTVDRDRLKFFCERQAFLGVTAEDIEEFLARMAVWEG